MKKLPCSLLAALFLTALNAALAAPLPVKTVSLTAGDGMRFSVTTITAQPGQTLHVEFQNNGSMPKDVMGHNWILLAAGEKPEAYATAALRAKAENYQPKTLQGQVLASIPLLGPGQTGDVTFTAPVKAGKYNYLCSFPAHLAAGMHGVLVVK